jgi:hypothetical protein
VVGGGGVICGAAEGAIIGAGAPVVVEGGAGTLSDDVVVALTSALSPVVALAW